MEHNTHLIHLIILEKHGFSCAELKEKVMAFKLFTTSKKLFRLK
jgi:hypothetical protein